MSQYATVDDLIALWRPLTAEEQRIVDDFAAKIDVENTAQILQYGAATQKKMADFSDAALANVRTEDRAHFYREGFKGKALIVHLGTIQRSRYRVCL